MNKVTIKREYRADLAELSNAHLLQDLNASISLGRTRRPFDPSWFSNAGIIKAILRSRGVKLARCIRGGGWTY